MCPIIAPNPPAAVDFVLIDLLYRLARPLLFSFDAERSHQLGLQGLEAAHRLGLTRLLFPQPVEDPVEVMGLRFPNRVGLAAGLDKDGEHLGALSALGFGFLEVGTVTLRPQAGNPRPRLFRLAAHRAMINRMGFNNQGVDAMLPRLRARPPGPLLGVNIGKNKDTALDLAVYDYLETLRKVYPLADYVTVNLSSPNTAGLRDLQAETALRDLCGRLKAEQTGLHGIHGRYVPLVLKLAPDLSADALRASTDVAMATGMDGLILCNTTISRPATIPLTLAGEAGGLSGAPLAEAALTALQVVAGHTGGKIPLIASGGLMTPEDARARIRAGASLVQLYSGLVYAGPGLVHQVAGALASQPPAAEVTAAE